MYVQAKYAPYEPSEFFADGMSSRPLVPGTVPTEEIVDDPWLVTGTIGGQPAAEFPFPVTERVLERGRERFGIFCTPCHGWSGYGFGSIVARGFPTPPSFHSDALRSKPVGYYVNIMTLGFGAMPSYRKQVPPDDRWAIAAYIRALQLSQNARIDDVPEDRRDELEEGGK